MLDWLLYVDPTKSRNEQFSPLEKTIDCVSNSVIFLMFVTLSIVLLRTWYQVDERRYPRWTLIAMGVLFAGEAIRRGLAVMVYPFPAWRLILVWDCLTVLAVTYGMWGQIRLADWAKHRTATLVVQIKTEHVKLQETQIERDNAKAELALLQAKQLTDSCH